MLWMRDLKEGVAYLFGGARRMLAAALEAKVKADLAAHADEACRRLVVRNGHAKPAGEHRRGGARGAHAAGG